MPEPHPSPYADPFAEGWQSWTAGGGNPYEIGSEDAEEWDDGRESAAYFHGAENAA